ncbi:MAG: AAA family ATPase [Lachnospiraceae bacterium]|nr:AAA family ATPase [Lachnospiraceae bacterium]
MASVMYSTVELTDRGRQNYKILVEICHKLEQEGYWRQAGSVMKQTIRQTLDLYVQSLMIGLAVRMEEISQQQHDFICSLTETDPLELRGRETLMDRDVVNAAEKIIGMPPILIQLCGVRDVENGGRAALRFMETAFNILHCLIGLEQRSDQRGQAYINDCYHHAIMFVQSEDQSVSERYNNGKDQIVDEGQNDEKEQIEAEREFQKVKKRIQQREKAEKEAQEKRIADLLEQLDHLIGLETVKKEINSLVNLIKVRHMREKMNLPAMDMSYHMVFTGNPGTGKTTVARLVAEIYRELGILSGGQLVETDRSRLVAGYVGQTAINVREVVEQAIGGVLFIDEAYALVSPDTGNDYGSEAVDTLVKMMEDHRDDLVVIVAGYPDEMQQFLRSNTGLISRFNKFIAFEDYTDRQLLDILCVMAADAGFAVEQGALDRLAVGMSAMTPQERKDFGNARGVRNIFEKMIVNQANRLVMLREPTREQLSTLTEKDAVFEGE